MGGFHLSREITAQLAQRDRSPARLERPVRAGHFDHALLCPRTQQDSADPGKQENEAYCGPTNVLAAAIYMKGPKGLSPIIEQTKNDSVSTYKGDPKQLNNFQKSMAGIEERIEKGELTNRKVPAYHAAEPLPLFGDGLMSAPL